MRQSRHGFVGNQQLRLCRHGTRQLELAHLDLRQVARPVVSFVGKPNHLKQFGTTCFNIFGVQRRARALVHRVKHRNAQIVGERQAGEWSRQLEASRQSAMRALMGGQTVDDVAIERHRTGLVLQRSANAIDQRAFAGAIGPNQAEPLARLDLEVDPVERDKASEALAQALDVQDGAHFALPARRRSCTSPTIPFGATITKPISSRPTRSRLTADEIVTLATCCNVPSSSVPTRGPTQLMVPPIIGMAIEFTAYSRPNADCGCRKPMKYGNGAPAMPISAPDTAVAISLSCKVGTPEASAASSSSRIAANPLPSFECSIARPIVSAAAAKSSLRTKR